jgi:hypothetical protein
MDKTNLDKEWVKNWYQDAEKVASDYHIEAYPTFIFLSYQGELVYKEVGYKSVSDLLTIAKKAIIPNNGYKNPYTEYDRLIAEYKEGILHNDSMFYMIKTALKVDKVLARQLLKSHTDYVSNLNVSERYTRENIKIWSLFSFTSQSRIFRFFCQDGDLIDMVMKRKGYSAAMIDKTITEEVVVPFFKEQNKNSAIAVTGMRLGGSGIKPDYTEADWKLLKKRIQEQFSRNIARRNVLSAKIEWYKRHRNDNAALVGSLRQYKRYPPDSVHAGRQMNDIAWEAFLNIRKLNLLKKVIKYTGKLVQEYPTFCELIDTHANLLYKIGRRKEAIKWEERAIEVATSGPREEFSKVLEHMKKGKATYGVFPL